MPWSMCGAREQFVGVTFLLPCRLSGTLSAPKSKLQSLSPVSAIPQSILYKYLPLHLSTAIAVKFPFAFSPR